MKSILRLFITFIFELFQPRIALQVEVLALRHQLIVLQRNKPKRLPILPVDRWIWSWIPKVWPQWRESLVIVKPETVIRWHREGFRKYWRLKSKSGQIPGRSKIGKEARSLIRQMSQENPAWGAPRIHGELLKLGFDIGQTSVGKYMVKPNKPPSQTWRTFLENHADQIVAMDFFTVPTIFFNILHVLILIDHERRRIIHFNVTINPTSNWVIQQIRAAFPWDTAPRFLLHDRDPVFMASQSAFKGMGIDTVITAPGSPWQNAVCERMVGTLRREILDHVIVLGQEHLLRLMASYLDYYHRARTHMSLEKDCPEPRPIQQLTDGRVVAVPVLGGLHHRYDRIAG